MLLRGNKQHDHFNQLVLNSPQQAHSPVPPRRQSFTAKSKTRARMSAANKTISIKQDVNNSSFVPKVNMDNSGELLPNSSFSFYNNQPALSQFDNLQLEDFLKYVIVGENKVPEDKSQEVIRSLNGTWFKNTQSS